MTIKVIDILNIFKTDNQIPTKIKVKHGVVYDYYKWSVKDQWYVTYDDTTLLRIACPKDLLEEVEIIEEDEIQPEDVLSFTLTDKVWTPRQARELIENFRKISEKLKSKKDNNKIEKLKRITKCIGTDEEGTYYTDEYTIPELVVKIDEIIDKLNNME